MNVHVEGGTGAGKRRPFEGAAKSWRCFCRVMPKRAPGRVAVCGPEDKMNPGYLVACSYCGARRDGAPRP